MARGIYEITLKERFFPARSEEDAMEMQNTGTSCRALSSDEVCVSMVVTEEHAIKLFLLAKTMYDTEKFELDEVRAAVRALLGQQGYWHGTEDIIECVLTWVERFDDMTPAELEEWLIG